MKRLFGLGKNPKTFEFKCKDCGDIHRGSPSFSYDKPVYYYEIPEAERDSRITIDTDMCTVGPAKDNPGGQVHHFIRVTLGIPIKGAPDPFLWGVWVSQSEESFAHYVDTFGTDQSGETSFGWLSVQLPTYDRKWPKGPMENLACEVQWASKGERPTINLHESDHPLFVDQRDGISWERAIEIATKAMHRDQ